jgi:steroid 5-alpha reductase family enzyme
MTFTDIWLQALLLITGLMTILWIISVFLKNVSIVDLFWGFGFVLVAVYYFINSEGLPLRKIIVLSLTAIWGLRLSTLPGLEEYRQGRGFPVPRIQKKLRERLLVDKFFPDFPAPGNSYVADLAPPSRVQRII